MWKRKGSLQGLFRKGFCLACLEFRLVYLQFALFSLSVAETLDGLIRIVRDISQWLSLGLFEWDFLVGIEERNELSDGRAIATWSDGIGGSLIEAGCAFGLSRCGAVSLLQELQMSQCLLIALKPCIPQQLHECFQTLRVWLLRDILHNHAREHSCQLSHGNAAGHSAVFVADPAQTVSACLFAVPRGVSQDYPALDFDQQCLLTDQHLIPLSQSCEILQTHQGAICHHQQFSFLEALLRLHAMYLFLPEAPGRLSEEHMQDGSITAVPLCLSPVFHKCGDKLSCQFCPFGEGGFECVLSLGETGEQEVLLAGGAIEEGLFAGLRADQDEGAGQLVDAGDATRLLPHLRILPLLQWGGAQERMGEDYLYEI